MKMPAPVANYSSKYEDVSLAQQNDPGSDGSDFGDGYSAIESVDRRTVSLLRLLLASAAFFITLIDPSVPERFLGLAYLLLAGYCLYSLYLYFLVLRGTYIIPVHLTHWVDVGWYSLFVAVSNGSSSIYFFFFFFAILVASFRWGYKEGVYVTAVSTVIFITVGYFGTLAGEAFELNRFLIRPLYLCVFGYMMAVWGGREIVFRRRLALLREVNELSNPRFGINRTLQSILSKVRAFYEADRCLLITRLEENPSKSKIWHSTRSSVQITQTGSHDDFAARIAQLSKGYAIVFAGDANGLFPGSQCYCVDPSTWRTINEPTVDCSAITELLSARHFVILPLYRHEELIGRLCITSDRNAFDRSEIGFLRQLVDQVLPSIENIQLLNRLASQAAEQQRQKTSRDIHDSTIQPYIGLKLGLEAVEMKCESGQSINDDIRKLIMLAESTISDLRGFAKNLSDEKPDEFQNVLLTAIQHQALKYKEFYGIDIIVEAFNGFHLNDRLAAETFQIVTEGLSNIRRHTEAKSAAVRLRQESGKLVLEIENANDGANAKEGFVPKSIAGRAKALGGRAFTKTSDICTKVTVEIPL